MGKLEMELLRATFLPLAAGGLLAGLLAWFGWQFWEDKIGHATLALKIGAVFVPAGIAGLVYWLAAMAFKIPAAKEMTALRWRNSSGEDWRRACTPIANMRKRRQRSMSCFCKCIRPAPPPSSNFGRTAI